MKKIAVVESFFEPHHKQQIEAAAAKYGYAVDYYLDGVLPKERAGEYEIVYGMPDRSALKDMTQLKWFCASFAGVDRYVDEALYPNSAVLLTNSAGAYGVTIAEHIIMVTLMLLRQMLPIGEAVRRREWLPPLPMRSICGANITVLGTGDIGTTFARRAKAMGARRICGVRRTLKGADPAFDRVMTMAELNTVLPDTDILVMALPSTSETAGVLNRERIALLPPHAVVVNVGRGTAVDQEALAEALNAGRIAGAALDVFVPEPLPKESPLWETRNLLITPHVAGNMSLGYTRDRDVEMFCEDLDNFVAGRPLAHLVNRKLGY